ncbi:HNH endonuclease signature motif containing protein [Microbacterium aurantiacum]|uniref:HNH endonuclease signature motif containing protein n=1 Tax=Microbacterium aurantiacum TaxID=162393 RepID=UPI001FE79CD3|nr:HNH endonuclease signature motif containing protein [Microbacterium aurantiacum]
MSVASGVLGVMTALVDATVEQVGALGALTDSVVEIERTISQLQAARDGLLALGSRLALEVAQQAEHPDYGDMALRTVAAELGAALRVSDRTVQRRMAAASFLVEQFPRVWQAQGAGRISAAHARVILDAGEHLDDSVARDAYAEQLIAFAEHESPNRVGRMARRVAERFQARPIEDRHQDARDKRGVWINDRADGMAEFGLSGPAALVHGAFERLTGMAKIVQAGSTEQAQPRVDECAEDPRTLDQLRCDLALDLLLTSTPAGHDSEEGLLASITAHVSVNVPVTTLMGAGTTPAELNGRIPIDPATARALAGAASGWDRILTHPITGALLAVDRYRPSAHLTRHLKARDQRCRFPTCGLPATKCDLDHNHDAALGGATSEENLGDLCRRHHVLKHHSPWHVEQQGAGIFAWTGPTGKVYLDRPPPQNTVTFTEDDTPPPF